MLAYPSLLVGFVEVGTRREQRRAMHPIEHDASSGTCYVQYEYEDYLLLKKPGTFFYPTSKPHITRK